ncbi:hypothetical protein D3C76_1094530 [compost metagenome]
MPFFSNVFLEVNPFFYELHKLIIALQGIVRFTNNLIIFHMKNLLSCTVNQDDSSITVHHQEASGHIRQYTLHQILIIVDLLQLLLKAVSHTINSLPKLPDLITSIQIHPRIIIKS